MKQVLLGVAIAVGVAACGGGDSPAMRSVAPQPAPLPAPQTGLMAGTAAANASPTTGDAPAAANVEKPGQRPDPK